MDVMLYVHIVTGGRPRPHVVRPYRNWWTSTDVMLYVHIVTGGRPQPDVVRPLETDGRPGPHVGRHAARLYRN